VLQTAVARMALDKVKQAEERARKAEENARQLREELEVARSEAERLSRFEPRNLADADRGLNRDQDRPSQAKLLEGIRQRDLTELPKGALARRKAAREPSEGIIERAVDAMAVAMGGGRRQGKAAASDIAAWTWGHSDTDDEEVGNGKNEKSYTQKRAEAEMQLLPDVVHL